MHMDSALTGGDTNNGQRYRVHDIDNLFDLTIDKGASVTSYADACYVAEGRRVPISPPAP